MLIIFEKVVKPSFNNNEKAKLAIKKGFDNSQKNSIRRRSNKN